MKKVVKELLDIETGEIIKLHEGDVITRFEQQKAIDKKKYRKKLDAEVKEYNNSLGGFTLVLFKYCDSLLFENKEIIPEDITRLFYLSTFVDYDGYIIINNNFIKKNKLKDILQLSKNSFDRFYYKMKNLAILEQDENKYIKINKKYFIKGSMETKIKKYYNYSRIYINSIRNLYENVNKRQHRHLGYIFKILPYVHRQTNILCWNPDQDFKLIKPISSGKLQDILGLHKQTIKNFINTMVNIKLKNGNTVIAFIKNSKDERNLPIIINSEIFYGGNFDLPEGNISIVKWFLPFK